MEYEIMKAEIRGMCRTDLNRLAMELIKSVDHNAEALGACRFFFVAQLAMWIIWGVS